MSYLNMSAAELESELNSLKARYEEYKAMKKRQHEHWKNSNSRTGMQDYTLTNPKAVEIAIRYLKRRTGKSRILRDGIEVTKRISRNGKSEYTIGYNRYGYALH